MGNLSSHETVETLREYRDPYNFESYDDWIAPISNDEQFLRKWHRLITRRLELADNDAFRQVFETVGREKGEIGYWSQQTFIEFFSNTTRCLHTTFREAKLFYDLILRLGSYPYIARPPHGRVPRLDFLTFKTGLMALSGRLTATTPIASGFKFTGSAGRKYRRLLFLALEEQAGAPSTPEDDGMNSRTDQDDEDLIDVLKLFESCRWEGPNPCLTYQGPQIPHRTAFQSSRSVPKGMVKIDKVLQLLKLSLVIKLWQFGIDIETPPIRNLDWTGVIEAIMASGERTPITPSDYISWPEFNKMFATIPRAFESLNPLFKPFISSTPTIALTHDMQTQKSNAFISHRLTNPPGTIPTLPLLSQILCSTWSDTLYTSHPLNPLSLSTHKLEYSGPPNAHFLTTLPSTTLKRKQGILLLTGITLKNSQPLTAGIYLNNNLDEFTTSFIFQSQPTNRSFAADREPGEPECAERMAMTHPSVLETRVKSRQGRQASMSLQLREGGIGCLQWEWDECGMGCEEFRVEKVEYISFGRVDK